MTHESTTRITITLCVDTANDSIQNDTATAVRDLFRDAGDRAARFVDDTAAFSGVDDTLAIIDGNGNTIGTLDIGITR